MRSDRLGVLQRELFKRHSAGEAQPEHQSDPVHRLTRVEVERLGNKLQ